MFSARRPHVQEDAGPGILHGEQLPVAETVEDGPVRGRLRDELLPGAQDQEAEGAVDMQRRHAVHQRRGDHTQVRVREKMLLTTRPLHRTTTTNTNTTVVIIIAAAVTKLHGAAPAAGRQRTTTNGSRTVAARCPRQRRRRRRSSPPSPAPAPSPPPQLPTTPTPSPVPRTPRPPAAVAAAPATAVRRVDGRRDRVRGRVRHRVRRRRTADRRYLVGQRLYISSSAVTTPVHLIVSLSIYILARRTCRGARILNTRVLTYVFSPKF